MVSITLSVPEEVRKVMKKYPEVNWSALARKAIEDKAKKMEMKQKLIEEAKEDQEIIDWSVKLGKKAKKGRAKRLNLKK